jgi:hypothetical protein
MAKAAPATNRPIVLDVPRFEQPDDLTCGPTCLAQLYRYYGLNRSVADVVGEIRRNPDGGTMAVFLGISALERGFAATIYSYNLRVFDPTWSELGLEKLIGKLETRARITKSERLRRSILAYADFLRLGGTVSFHELDKELLASILRRSRPILTGLSATYLYRTPREYREEYDDIRGNPVGHFVVVCGYDPATDEFLVRDPQTHIPFSPTGRYSVGGDRLIASILLGDVTYDAVLLELWPKQS